MDPAPSVTTSDIILPWRSFKAYVQLFDLSERKFSTEAPRRARLSLLAASNTRAGENTRAPLFAHDLIEVTMEGRLGIKRGVPYGRKHLSDLEPGNPIVSPQTRSAAGAAWIRTFGRCAYCGRPLAFFSQLALGLEKESGERLFSCKRCHAMRGPRSLEDFRFLVEMEQFQRRHGVRFDRRQVEYLQRMGVRLDMPACTFWFERYQPPQQRTG